MKSKTCFTIEPFCNRIFGGRVGIQQQIFDRNKFQCWVLSRVVKLVLGKQPNIKPYRRNIKDKNKKINLAGLYWFPP